MSSLIVKWNVLHIVVPVSYLTQLSEGSYELDTEVFRRDLRELEASPAGMGYPATHNRNAEFTVAGTTLAQSLEIINGWMIKFEDGLYSVTLKGSNNNIWDIEGGILIRNDVQVIPTNSAGLVGQSFTAEQARRLDDLWRRHGLDPDNPLVVTPELVTAGDDLQVDTAGDGTSSLTQTRRAVNIDP